MIILPADNHCTKYRGPPSVEYVMCEGIVMCDVHPQGENEEEPQTDDRCYPMMGAIFRI